MSDDEKPVAAVIDLEKARLKANEGHAKRKLAEAREQLEDTLRQERNARARLRRLEKRGDDE